MNDDIHRFLELDTMDQGESLLDQIRDRVDQYLAENPELLMSYLYRLDIAEHKIQAVLKFSSDVPHDLAKLIYSRQLERLHTKQQYKQDPIEGWEY